MARQTPKATEGEGMTLSADDTLKLCDVAQNLQDWKDAAQGLFVAMAHTIARAFTMGVLPYIRAGASKSDTDTAARAALFYLGPSIDIAVKTSVQITTPGDYTEDFFLYIETLNGILDDTWKASSFGPGPLITKSMARDLYVELTQPNDPPDEAAPDAIAQPKGRKATR